MSHAFVFPTRCAITPCSFGPVRRYRAMNRVMRYGVMGLWERPRVMALWRYDPVGVNRRYRVTRYGVIDPVSLHLAPRPRSVPQFHLGFTPPHTLSL
eukprot:2073417-Prymnesium_polylepis.1